MKKKKKSNSAHHTVTLWDPHTCAPQGSRQQNESSAAAVRWHWEGGDGGGGAEVALRWRRWHWGGRGGAGMREVAEMARRWWMWPWGSGGHVALRKWGWRWGGSGASGSGTRDLPGGGGGASGRLGGKCLTLCSTKSSPLSEDRGQWLGKGDGGSRQRDTREELPAVCPRMLALELLGTLRLKRPLLGHG